MSLDDRPITAGGIREAAARLDGVVVKTPLIEHPTLNERVGGRVLVKAEVLQLYGSFKLRGAYNRLSQLTAKERTKGVVAWSSGNHAQGVAYAGKLLGCPVTIVMPADAPEIKMKNVRALGAEVVTYDRYTDDREVLGHRIADERGMLLAPSYDHPLIMEGQGTVGLETFHQAAQIGATLDCFITCCGGGGLTAGCATILEELSPKTDIWIAEPEGYDESWASIRDGKVHVADVTQPTICDAIATPTPGVLTFPIMQRLVNGGATITEKEVAEAMRFAFETLKLIVEPGGAVALAAVLSGKYPAKGKTVAVTLSGGNVDLKSFVSIMER